MHMRDRQETPREMDERLKRLVREMRTTEAELARTLLEMKRRRYHHCLGYSRIQDYACEELRMGRGKAKELVELAEKLEKLPKIRQAFEAGEVDWTKCRTVSRVATAETEEHWLEEALALSSRGLELAVARAKGETPVVRITIEVSEAEAADIDAAIRSLREERGKAVPMGVAVAELCRRAMGPPLDRPGHQVVIHECPTCEKATRDTRNGSIDVQPKEVAAAREDAAILDLTRGGTGAFKHTITPSERRAVIARDRGRCAVCGAQAWLHIHHLARKDGDIALLSLMCSSCHQGLVHRGHVTLRGRAPDLDIRLRDGQPLRTREGVT